MASRESSVPAPGAAVGARLLSAYGGGGARLARAFVALSVAFTLTCLLFALLNVAVAAWFAYREARPAPVFESFGG